MALGLANVAGVSQSDIELIKTLIGDTNDTGGTTSVGSLMAKLNKALQNESSINTLIGAANNTGGSTTAGTVMAKLNALLQKFTSGGIGIKKVQRGTFIEKDFTQEKSTATTITLSTIDPTKTFIIVNGGVSSGYSGSSTAARGYIGSVTATGFTYYSGRATATINGGISWQAVEFY